MTRLLRHRQEKRIICLTRGITHSSSGISSLTLRSSEIATVREIKRRWLAASHPSQRNTLRGLACHLAWDKQWQHWGQASSITITAEAISMARPSSKEQTLSWLRWRTRTWNHPSREAFLITPSLIKVSRKKWANNDSTLASILAAINSQRES